MKILKYRPFGVSFSLAGLILLSATLTAPNCSLLAQVNSPAQESLQWSGLNDKHFQLYYTTFDSSLIGRFRDFLESSNKLIRDFFGEPFEKAYEVHLFPNRESLDEQWRKDWKLPDFKSECWMVASGVGYRLDILSPRVWAQQACEHNPDDSLELRLLISHELVHVFHGQHNPIPSFEGLDDIGWFVEGLAIYVSGQLDSSRLANAKEIVKQGKTPTKLEDAWSGKFKYAIAGSIVQYVDHAFGRRVLKNILTCTNENQILEQLKVSETTLLNEWKRSLGAGE